MNEKLTLDIFIERSNVFYGNKYDYSKSNYINSKSKICVICPIHGEFLVNPGNHVSGKSGCPKCSNNYKKDNKDFIKKAIEIHGDKYDYSKVDYKGKSEKVCIICSIHGEFWQRATYHISKKGSGCPKCSIENKYKNTKFSEEELRYKFNLIHNFKYDYVFNCGVHIKSFVNLICQKHGVFKVKIRDVLYSGSGCRKCKHTSKGEKRIEEILKNYGMFYESQKVFDDCINPETNHKLIFDFYLPEYNVCIEFDGKQHFEPISFGKNNKYEMFDTLKKRDKTKNEYCKNKNIKLIRISYASFDEIEDIIIKNVINPKYLVILDIDGVLCKDKMYNEEGLVIAKNFVDIDFTAIKVLKSFNIPVVFLSGDRFNEGVAKKRYIPFYYGKVKGFLDKSSFVSFFEKKYGINRDKFIYVGDDVYDEKIMSCVGYAFCPNSASISIKDFISENFSEFFVLDRKAGEGVIDELNFKLRELGIIEKTHDLKRLINIDAIEQFRV